MCEHFAALVPLSDALVPLSAAYHINSRSVFAVEVSCGMSLQVPISLSRFLSVIARVLSLD